MIGGGTAANTNTQHETHYKYGEDKMSRNVYIVGNDGVIKESDLLGTSLEEVMDLIDALESSVAIDNENLKVLKAKRSKMALDLFESTYQGKTEFTTEKHIVRKTVPETVSGKAFHDNQSVLWDEVCKDHPELLDASKSKIDRFLTEKGIKPATRKRILSTICVPQSARISSEKRV